MIISSSRLVKIIKEELDIALKEISASAHGYHTVDEFRPEFFDNMGIPVSQGRDLDPDDDSDDALEMIDFISDEFSRDQIDALISVLGRAKSANDTEFDYVKRKYMGDPNFAMQQLVTGY